MSGWTVATLSQIVDEEIAALPADVRAKLARYASLIEKYGLAVLPQKATKHLEEKLWELRLTGRDGISRVIYVTASGRRVVLLRAFIKKTQKTPNRELDLARERARTVS